MKKIYTSFLKYLEQPIPVAPLVTFRMIFGLVMLFSCLRYMWMGWVDAQLVDPLLHFHYYGFDWVRPLPRAGMYGVFILMSVACLAIFLGWFYRLFTVVFFLCFTYVELIDITYYLNHYYFVSIVAFLMIFVPANSYFSLDVLRNPLIKRTEVSRWCIGIFKLQIAIVYCFAGLAKINYDWLMRALPLSIWLPAKTGIPFIGFVFKYKFTAFLFSWIGMLFDTFIVLGLLFKKTRWLSYIAVVIFHTLTGILFQIGVFPIVMIFAVTIFFSASFHQQLLEKLSALVPTIDRSSTDKNLPTIAKSRGRIVAPWLICFFAFQILFPWRYLLYPGNVFWTEEGYRFSWRVMLMEKAGTATFFVKDAETGREGSVINNQFLNPHQEKQMAMQPDLILQYAKYLKAYYLAQGTNEPQVRAEVFVTLNARPAQLLIDPAVDLPQQTDQWKNKEWILPLKTDTLK